MAAKLPIFHFLLRALSISWLLVWVPCCLLYFINPQQWWPMGIVSIAFWPINLGGLVLVILLFIARQPLQWALLLAWLCLLSLTRRYLGLHLPHSQPKGLASTARLRVMQWNCAELQGFYPAQGVAKMEGRRQIAALISQWQPQIICIQDFTEQYYPPATYSNIALLADSLGYRYYNLSAAGHPVASGNPIFAGTAIFSKLPLVACGAVPYPARQVPEHIVWANMLWNGKTIRIATTHFASMHLGWRPQPPLPPHLKEDSAIITGSSKLNKLQHFQAYHVQQARQLRHFLDTCSLPTLLGADLNSTPASWAYQQVKANYTDAFLAKGWGLGKTYKHGWPGLRIDYLLASPEWRVARFWQSAHSHSDHHVLMAEFFIP